MSIYATNRMGRVAEMAITANESYTSTDLGRILYESQVNDMAIFEAVVASDLNEMKAVREGTLLESEIVSLNEASAKEFINSMIDRIKAFWRKIKGVFRDIKRKIAAYLLGDGKAFIEEFEKKFEDLRKNGLPKNKKYDVDIEQYFDISKVNLLTPAEVENAIKSEMSSSSSRTEILQIGLAKSLDRNASEGLAPADFGKAFYEKTCEKKTLYIGQLKANITSGSEQLKKLAELEKAVDKKLGELESSLKAEERKLAKDSGEKAGAIISRISMLVSIYENITAMTIKLSIGGIKKNITQSRIGLSKILKEAKKDVPNAKTDKTDDKVEALHNSADIVAEDEVEEAIDSTVATAADADVEAAIDDMVSDAEAAVDTAE